MQTINSYKISINRNLNEDNLAKGMYISIIHASRIPPHIGMVINNKYHSLTIKGHEINQSVAALIKNSKIRKVPSLFIKIKTHPAFSTDYLDAHFISNIQQFNKVEAGKSSCLSPVKLFFEETFDLPMKNINYIFELLPELEKLGMIEEVCSMFIEEKEFQLPVYSFNEINKGIETANREKRKIRDLIRKQLSGN
jgi:hypothetical protein